jgi:hypothetical protein
MLVEKVYMAKNGRCAMIMDSITSVGANHEGVIVVSASHGGISAAEYALKTPLAAVFFNDAGVGKDEAGIAGLKMLQEKGIPAGAVSHETAQIGDGKDTWEFGVISNLNHAAQDAGFQVNEKVRDAVIKFADTFSSPPK